MPSRYHISLSPDVTQRDEAYVKALSKFNEWRHKQIFGSTSSKAAKKAHKKSKKRKGKKETDLNNTSLSYYEVGPSEVGGKVLGRKSCPAKANMPESPGGLDGQTIYENEILEFESDFAFQSPVHSHFRFEAVSSPPGHFYKDSSNPFEHVISPNRRRQALPSTPEDISTYSPRNHENTTAIISNEFDDTPHRPNIQQQEHQNRRKSRNPTYKTVKNKYGEEVEYALPFSQKSDDYSLEESRDSNDNEIPFDTTKHYQEIVDDTFRFLNEKSRMEASKGIVQVTDLDKTDGTVKTDDQQESALQELNSLATWRKTIGISAEEFNTSVESVQQDLVSILYFFSGFCKESKTVNLLLVLCSSFLPIPTTM